jgi:hypothetical protein
MSRQTYNSRGLPDEHTGGKIDIELDPYGNVVSVWWGCALLPFQTTFVDKERARDMRDSYNISPDGIGLLHHVGGNMPTKDITPIMGAKFTSKPFTNLKEIMPVAEGRGDAGQITNTSVPETRDEVHDKIDPSRCVTKSKKRKSK